MGIWIHDDINWPSGTAGGELTRENPELAARYIVLQRGRLVEKISSFKIAYQHAPYIDVLNHKAAQSFIDSTYEKYKARFPKHFGFTIRGFFCDEPAVYAGIFGRMRPGALPYSSSVIERFKELHGYDPWPHLPKIWQDNGAESRKIRLDYWETVTDLYVNGFLGELRDWCHENKVLFIGHPLEEEDPLNLIKSQGDPFLALTSFDWVGYDLISNFSKNHLIAARLVKSVANIYGKTQILTEVFGAFGWRLTLDEMVRIVRWLVRQGTTVLVLHALFYSIREDRREESPPSLWEEPYSSEFADIVEEFRDLVKEQSLQDSEIAIYFPVSALWAMYNPADERAARAISETIKTVSLSLGDKGVNFDYINDDGIGAISGRYRKIIIPRAEVMPVGTLQELRSFVQDGGEYCI